MEGLPFEIPGSLKSYMVKFERDPDRGIEDLKAHLKKRGFDPVGYLLLSWFYHVQGDLDNALKQAFKCRCSSPGSSLFNHLPYFLVHPEKFEAWKPYEEFFIPSGPDEVTHRQSTPAPKEYDLDLDELVSMLSEAEGKKIVVDSSKKDDRDLGKSSSAVSDIASETLAKIYEKQNRMEEALETLKRLKQAKPEKADFFENEIERIHGLHSVHKQDS